MFCIVAPIVTIHSTNGINQSETNVTFNTRVNITCEVESYPPAWVYWEVNGRQVSDNKEVSVDTSKRGTNVTYTCVAVNNINGTNHSANNSINVITQGKIMLSNGYLHLSYVMDVKILLLK